MICDAPTRENIIFHSKDIFQKILFETFCLDLHAYFFPKKYSEIHFVLLCMPNRNKRKENNELCLILFDRCCWEEALGKQNASKLIFPHQNRLHFRHYGIYATMGRW
jgi:hypothetical protein